MAKVPFRASIKFSLTAQKVALTALLAAAPGAALLRAQEPVSGTKEWVRQQVAIAENVAPPLRAQFRARGIDWSFLNPGLLKDFRQAVFEEALPLREVNDQGRTGRCWDFAATNAYRAMLLQAGVVTENFDFSQSYVNYFALYEKVDKYLAGALKLKLDEKWAEENRDQLFPGLAIQEGGYFPDFLYVVHKWGIVPRSAMRDTAGAQNSGRLITELQDLAAAYAERIMQTNSLDEAKALQEEARRRTIENLTAYFGAPPTEFSEDGVNYNPDSYRDARMRLHDRAWVVVTSNPLQPMGKAIELENSAVGQPLDGASFQGEPENFNHRSLNVSPERMLELVQGSIAREIPVWFSSDYSGSTDYGTGFLDDGLLDRAALTGNAQPPAFQSLSRYGTHFYGRVAARHVMLIDGVSKPTPTRPWTILRAENTWGDQDGTVAADGSGLAGGYYFLSERWFKDRVIEVVIPRDSTLLRADEIEAWRAPKKVERWQDFEN